MGPPSDHPLADLCDLWLRKIESAKQFKERVFGATAKECMAFYNGPHDFMYNTRNARNALGMYIAKDREVKTTFKVTTNKVAEIVQRFGPSLYFNNPNRKVGPNKPNVSPAALQLLGNPYAVQAAFQEIGERREVQEASAELMEWMLNYTPNELDLMRHSRLSISECLIKGLGVMWTEVFQPTGSRTKLIGSFHDSCDRLILDPDADTEENCKWVVRECIHPKWEVEQEYGLPPGSIKGNLQSVQAKSNVGYDDTYSAARYDGKSNDLVAYYKIYSKMGMGDRLKGGDEDLSSVLEQFGENVFLVVARNTPFPLNLPPDLMDLPLDQPGAIDQVKAALRWPIPLWGDDTWCHTSLGFHSIPGCPYPMAHLKPGLGELRFINWCLSFLADKVYLTSRDYIAIAEHAFEDLEPVIKSGDNLAILKIKKSLNQKITDLVQFLQHPPMNKDILDIVQLAMTMFDKRVGLTELMYGASEAQYRSSEEAKLKGKMSTIVVNDMAACAARWQTTISRKEGLANQFLVSPADVAPVFGEQWGPPQMPGMPPQVGPISQLWAQLLYRPPNYDDPESIYATCREYEYRIEADSLAVPDTARDMDNMDQFLQSPFAAQIMGRYQMTGDPTQVNALMTEWAGLRKFDPEPFLFPAMPPPPPMPAPGQAPQGQTAA